MRFFGGKRNGKFFLSLALAGILVFSNTSKLAFAAPSDSVTKVVDDHVLYEKIKGQTSYYSCISFDDSTWSITATPDCVSYLYFNADDSDGERITDISVLPELFPNLKDLSISELNVTDFDSINRLSLLTQLSIRNSGLKAIPAFTLPNLYSLDLEENEITEIENLSDLPSLGTLRLSNNKITNVGDLSYLSNLHDLDLQSNEIEFFGNLPVSLQYLNLDDNKITSTGDLSYLQSLYSLYLSDNKLNSLGDLPASLGRIRADNNNISSLSALEGLTNISDISFSNNGISSVSDLDVSNLRYVDLKNNLIEDISVFEDAHELYEFDLSNNRISVLPDLGSTSIEELGLNKNNISDISGLAGLESKLGSLLLGGNNVTDISALRGFNKLRYLRLSDNNISNIDALFEMPDIRYLFIDGNPGISDYTALADMKQMRELNVSGNNLDNELFSEILSYISDDNRTDADSEKIDYLSASNNPKISDCSVINGKFSGLEELHISGNSIEELCDFSDLEELYILDLSDNKIEDISGIKDKLKSGFMGYLIMQRNRIKDVTPAANMIQDEYSFISFAGNHINEMVDLGIGDDSFAGGVSKYVPFFGQKFELSFNGNTGQLPKIAKQMDDAISEMKESDQVPEGIRNLLHDLLHLENVSISGDFSTATVLDSSKPASISMDVDYEAFLGAIRDDEGGKGGGISDDYDEGLDGDDAMVKYYFGHEDGDNRIRFLSINIVSDGINNPNTIDNVVAVLAGSVVIVNTAIALFKRNRTFSRR